MSNREFTAQRTMLANAFATAGAELLEYMGVSSALAAIPNTEPPQYVVAGTLQMIAKALPPVSAAEKQTADLTDERAIYDLAAEHEANRNGLYGPVTFDATGLVDFARDIERAAIAAYLARQAQAAPAVPEQVPAIGRLLDEFSALPVLWGLNEPGALVRHSDVFKMLVAAGKTYLAAPSAAAPAAPEQVQDSQGNRTYMDDKQAHGWAWGQVKRDVGTNGWTVGEHFNYFGFFLHGWRYGRQYERQGTTAAPASQEGAHAALEAQAEEWSYSTDEERYHDPEPSRLAILQHALAEVEAADDGASQFWIGRNVRFTGKGNAGVIIDGLKEQAYDECGEFAETYLEDVTPAEEAELESLVTDWARRVDRSNFWTVSNTECFTIESAKAEIERLTPASAERSGDHE
ncbi:hypothetical protein [Massilia sp. CT11-137]|uniref:hypothetical protein n=1 Tax=Massilia sp. CT11-137 TaxID=3393901 RepID=UPI0039AEA2D0